MANNGRAREPGVGSCGPCQRAARGSTHQAPITVKPHDVAGIIRRTYAIQPPSIGCERRGARRPGRDGPPGRLVSDALMYIRAVGLEYAGRAGIGSGRPATDVLKCNRAFRLKYAGRRGTAFRRRPGIGALKSNRALVLKYEGRVGLRPIRPPIRRPYQYEGARNRHDVVEHSSNLCSLTDHRSPMGL